MKMELENSVPMFVYNEMTADGKRYIDFLLDADAMPAELSYLLEAWTQSPKSVANYPKSPGDNKNHRVRDEDHKQRECDSEHATDRQ